MTTASKLVKDPDSCLGKALEDEECFLLLARDPAAAMIVRAWAVRRMQLGLGHADDPQIVEAFVCAEAMDLTRPVIRVRLGKENVEARVERLNQLIDEAARAGK